MKSNIWLSVRRGLFILLTVFSYIGFIYFLFFNIHYIYSVYALIIFLVSIRFFLIELKNYGIKYLWSILLMSAFVEMFLLGFSNLFLVFAMYVVNIWMIGLVFKINNEINNRKNISSMQMFGVWNVWFVFVCAISYAFVIAGTYNQAQLSCQKDSKNDYIFLNNLLDPSPMSTNVKSEINGKLKTMMDTKLKDILWVGSQAFDCASIQKTLEKKATSASLTTSGNVLSWENLSWDVLTGEALSWDILTWTQNLSGTQTLSGALSWSIFTGDIPDVCALLSGVDLTTLDTIASGYQPKKWFLGFISKFQRNILTNLQDTRNEDTTLCNFVSDITKDPETKTWFSFLVLALTISPLFIGFFVLFCVVSFFGFMLFGLFRLLKIYKYQTVKEDVDEII